MILFWKHFQNDLYTCGNQCSLRILGFETYFENKNGVILQYPGYTLKINNTIFYDLMGIILISTARRHFQPFDVDVNDDDVVDDHDLF